MFIAFVIHRDLIGDKVLRGVFEVKVVCLAVRFVTIFFFTDDARGKRRRAVPGGKQERP